MSPRSLVVASQTGGSPGRVWLRVRSKHALTAPKDFCSGETTGKSEEQLQRKDRLQKERVPLFSAFFSASFLVVHKYCFSKDLTLSFAMAENVLEPYR